MIIDKVHLGKFESIILGIDTVTTANGEIFQLLMWFSIYWRFSGPHLGIISDHLAGDFISIEIEVGSVMSTSVNIGVFAVITESRSDAFKVDD